MAEQEKIASGRRKAPIRRIRAKEKAKTPENLTLSRPLEVLWTVQMLHITSKYGSRAEFHYIKADLHKVTIEPSSYTDEKFRMYKKYQMAVHGDTESKVSEKGFRRFLCESPLEVNLQP